VTCGDINKKEVPRIPLVFEKNKNQRIMNYMERNATRSCYSKRQNYFQTATSFHHPE